MPLAIRPATLADIPAIRALEQQAASAAHWSENEYKHLVSNAIVLVAEQEHEICGVICAKPVAGEWDLENIVVAKTSLRRGVADSLMRALLDHINRSGAGRNVFLEVRESNLPARRLYEKHGLKETGRRRNYYQNPSEDAILYARPLAKC